MFDCDKKFKILYLCGKCDGIVNPETLFCEICRYQFNLEDTSWVHCVKDFVILFVLLAITDWDMQMEWDFVESVQRHGRLMTLFVNVVKTRPVGNQDNVINELQISWMEQTNMRHLVCITHSFAIFTICSTLEEYRNHEYSYGMNGVQEHLIKYNGKGCILAPVDFQKASDYIGSWIDNKISLWR